MSEARERNRSGLIEAAQRGERWAETEIVGLIRSFAKQICHTWGTGESVAGPEWEDVAQEAGRRFFAGSLHNFIPGGPERSYLYSLVKATRIQIYRSLRRRAQREADSEPPGGSAGDPEARTLLHRILKRLPEACREILQRTFLDGAATAELARELGIAESSVRSRLTRCLQKARAVVS